MIVSHATVAGADLSYTLCRALPETALMLRDVLREAARLWSAQLGADRYTELLALPEGEAFFNGRVRIEPVPPVRDMLAVWLPFPDDFIGRVRPQLVDSIEAFDREKMAMEPPRGWPGWDL